MGETIVSMLAVFGVAVVASYLLTPVAERLCWRFGLVDKPRPGELQVKPAARAGGYAMLVAFLIALAVSLPLFHRQPQDQYRLIGFVVGLGLVVPLALVDDVKRLSPGAQMLGQFAIAGVALAFGLIIDNVANPFGGLIALPLLVAVPFTIFWVVGMMNTINWIDTMDGLVAGITAIAALVLFVRSFQLGQYEIAVLSLALVGVCLGFLPFNFNPARVFAGSGGSYFLGYSLAILAIIGGAKLATALMVLGLPILDTAVVILRRLLAGRSPFRGGDNAHLVHRMAQGGYSIRQIALLIYAFSALTGVLAIELSGVIKLYVFALVALIFVGAAVVLAVRARRRARASVAR